MYIYVGKGVILVKNTGDSKDTSINWAASNTILVYSEITTPH